MFIVPLSAAPCENCILIFVIRSEKYCSPPLKKWHFFNSVTLNFKGDSDILSLRHYSMEELK